MLMVGERRPRASGTRRSNAPKFLWSQWTLRKVDWSGRLYVELEREMLGRP